MTHRVCSCFGNNIFPFILMQIQREDEQRYMAWTIPSTTENSTNVIWTYLYKTFSGLVIPIKHWFVISSWLTFDHSIIICWADVRYIGDELNLLPILTKKCIEKINIPRKIIAWQIWCDKPAVQIHITPKCKLNWCDLMMQQNKLSDWRLIER